jgi:hypothetical protein
MQSRSTVVALFALTGCAFPGHGGADGGAPADAVDGRAGEDGAADAAIDALPPDADPCIPPYARTANGCHYFTGLTSNSAGAAAICAGTFGGGLPIVETAGESIFLGQTALGANPDARVWTGLTNNAGTWTWRDGTAATFTMWVPGEPSGNGPCVVLRNDGTWGDRPCEEIHGVVCELP